MAPDTRDIRRTIDSGPPNILDPVLVALEITTFQQVPWCFLVGGCWNVVVLVAIDEAVATAPVVFAPVAGRRLPDWLATDPVTVPIVVPALVPRTGPLPWPFGLRFDRTGQDNSDQRQENQHSLCVHGRPYLSPQFMGSVELLIVGTDSLALLAHSAIQNYILYT